MPDKPARVFDPADICPLCNVAGKCALASEFSVMGGHHVFRACVACQRCSDNGHDKGPLVAYREGP